MIAAEEGWKPRLRVASRAGGGHAENMYTHDGWYRWPWADRIGEASDPAAAAQAVMAALSPAEVPE